jgi:flavin-binding protein dodecin
MSILKVIEVMSNSSKSWEDAVQNAVADASRTIRNIRSVYIKEQTAHVENDKVVEYRIIAKMTFEIDQA